MTKTKFWLSILAISVVLIAGSMAASPIAIADDDDDDDDDDDKPKRPKEVIVANTEPIPVTGSISSNPICPAENVQHWATYQWDSGILFIHPTLPSVDFGSLEVQVPSDRSYTGPEVVANTLNELGYSNSGSPILPSNVAGSFLSNNMGVICAEN